MHVVAHGQLRRPDKYCPETVGIQWRRDLEGPLHSPSVLKVHSRLSRDSGSKVASEQPATRTNVPDLLERLVVVLCVLVVVVVVAGSCCRKVIEDKDGNQ